MREGWFRDLVREVRRPNHQLHRSGNSRLRRLSPPSEAALRPTVRYLVEHIRDAFSWRPYPGDDNLVGCRHDKRYGGDSDGPCASCVALRSDLRGKSMRDLGAADLRRHTFTGADLSIEAY